MNIDFSLILLNLTVITGIVWAADKWLFSRRRSQNRHRDGSAMDTSGRRDPLIVEYSRFLFPVVLIVLVLRSFVAEPFRIPSGSMLPTLEIGDFILVNKFTYGLRLPVWNTKFISISSPHRGDVIVFRYPENPSIDYIKRVVGVPGDEISYQNKIVYVNGRPSSVLPEGQYPTPENLQFDRFNEDLAGVKHSILTYQGAPSIDFAVTVPAGKYFVMGDNRDNSKDSRYWGFMPEENLVGKAIFVWMNWQWGDWPKLSRVGTFN